jgi:hypothetical protein
MLGGRCSTRRCRRRTRLRASTGRGASAGPPSSAPGLHRRRRSC